MENNEKDLELIIRYFDLALSGAELSKLEKRIKKDLVFAQKIQDYKESVAVVNTTYKSQKDEERIEKWRDILNSRSQSTPKKAPWKLFTGIAASFLVLIMGWQITKWSKGPDLKELAQQSWDKNVGLGYYTNRDNSTDSIQSIIVTAYTAYKNKDYATAINSLQGFESTSSYYEDALLIRALSTYKMGDTPTALATLDSLIKDPTKKIAKVAQWYKGLIYLEMKDLTAAQQFLELPDTKNDNIKLKE